MTATLHEIEFRHGEYSFMVSGEVEGATDAPSVEVTALLIEYGGEFSPIEKIASVASVGLRAVAENALIQAAEDRRLIYSCECCHEEFYGRPPECPGCEDRKEAAIDRGREV